MRQRKLYKYLHFDPYGLGALCLIAHATVLRLLLISNWPVLNSDEGTMGLMALHIVNQGKIPLFFYGQGYVGSLEPSLPHLFFFSLALRISHCVLGPFFSTPSSC